MKTEKKKEKRDIIAIITPDAHQVIVAHVMSGNARREYMRHFRRERTYAMEMFNDVENLPDVYLIEQVEKEENVSGHCFALMKRLEEAGYEIMMSHKARGCFAQMSESTLRTYQMLKDVPIDQIITPSKCILRGENISRERKASTQKTKAVPHIKFDITAEDKAAVEAAAREQGISLSQYCRRKVLFGGDIQINPPAITECIDQLDRIVSRLECIMEEYYHTGATCDLCQLETLVREVCNCKADVVNAYGKYALALTQLYGRRS